MERVHCFLQILFSLGALKQTLRLRSNVIRRSEDATNAPEITESNAFWIRIYNKK